MKSHILGILIMFSSFGLLSLIVGITETDGVESVVYSVLGVVLIGIAILILFIQQNKRKEQIHEKKLKMLYAY